MMMVMIMMIILGMYGIKKGDILFMQFAFNHSHSYFKSDYYRCIYDYVRFRENKKTCA